MKYIAIVFGLLVVVVLGSGVYSMSVGNARVAEQIRNDPDSERARTAMLLTFPDGKVIPVNFLREGNQVFAGSDFGWWRAFEAGDVPVELVIRGERLTGKARVELDDKAYIEDVFSRLRPTTPGFLTHWGKLVIIDLDEAPAREESPEA